MLWDRHREALLHTELCHAYTTAAVLNSLLALDEPIAESVFMPNLQLAPKSSELLALDLPQDQIDDFRSQRAHLAALLEKYKNTGVVDPLLVKMGLFASQGNDG